MVNSFHMATAKNWAYKQSTGTHGHGKVSYSGEAL